MLPRSQTRNPFSDDDDDHSTKYPLYEGDYAAQYHHSIDYHGPHGANAGLASHDRDDAPLDSYTHHGPHRANAGLTSHEGDYAAQYHHSIDYHGPHGANAGLASHDRDYAARLAARLAARNMFRRTMFMRFPHMRLPLCMCPHAAHHANSNNYHGPHGANAGFASHYGDEAVPYPCPYNHCRRWNGSYVGHSPVPPQYPHNHN